MEASRFGRRRCVSRHTTTRATGAGHSLVLLAARPASIFLIGGPLPLGVLGQVHRCPFLVGGATLLLQFLIQSFCARRAVFARGHATARWYTDQLNPTLHLVSVLRGSVYVARADTTASIQPVA